MAANRTSDNLTSALKASGTTQNGSLAEQISSLSTQLQELNATNMMLTQQELAYGAPSSTTSSGGSSVLDTIGSILGGGLGLSSLISGLFGLFGGGGNSTPPPVTPYVAPLPIQSNAGFSNANGGSTFGADFAQGNIPRAMADSSPTSITVQVQAMDSQSFLDHSQDIALAVRQAMLQSTVLNDVIRSV
jgi:hypothetical protein